jgi:D-aminopeptidase
MSRGLVIWAGTSYDEEAMPAKEKAMPVLAISGLALASALVLLAAAAAASASDSRPRAREFGLVVGVLPPGPLNAVTDVAGVAVGQVTIIEGKDVRTGVTVILPHGGNIFQDKVPAGISVGNGYGKLTGVTQVRELGTLESPIVLTNTLSVPVAADAVIDWTLGLPGNERVGSVNPVVGETNDGWLNDIRGRHVSRARVLEAIRAAAGGPVAEGAVGAGTGTTCFDYKGGIGTSSRRLAADRGGYTVGVLVQTNFGGVLTLRGLPFDRKEAGVGASAAAAESDPCGDGSCMIVVATDAPLDARDLERLAKRALLGIARTGGYFSNGSGDYAIAFSTAPSVRVPHRSTSPTRTVTLLHDDAISPLFQAAAEAAEEAIWNSLFKAVRTEGRDGHVAEALPLDRVRELLK